MTMEENLDTYTHTERMPCEDEGRYLQTKKYQRVPANYQSPEEASKTFSLTALRRFEPTLPTLLT